MRSKASVVRVRCANSLISVTISMCSYCHKMHNNPQLHRLNSLKAGHYKAIRQMSLYTYNADAIMIPEANYLDIQMINRPYIS